jgi:hypothetical protein
MDTRVVIFVIGAIAVVALIAGLIYMRRRHTELLRTQFGPEYERSLREKGSATRAQAELEQRMQRVSRLDLHPLTEPTRQRYWERWLGVQRTFVDDPRFAVAAADDLIADVMKDRGYPSENSEQRAADISVSHPRVVAEYRVACEIARRNRNAEATTEELRTAIKSYRALFEDLLETGHERREVA